MRSRLAVAPRPSPRQAVGALKAVMQQVETATKWPSFATRSLTREDVRNMNKQLEERAKALIAIEEELAMNRPKLRVTLKHRIGPGEVWKIVGSPPELGRMQPEVAPAMKWTEGDVWVYETPIRAGSHKFKAVLYNSHGAYVWEAGPDHVVDVGANLTKKNVLGFDLEVRLP